jgi:dipeptidyl-peptidase-4
MRTLLLLFVPAALVFAQEKSPQKKPVTLESLAGRGGRGGFGDAGGPPSWAPDGKTFAFRQGRNLMLYNPAAKSSREILSLEPLDAAAVRPPAEERFNWDNRRLRLAGLEWSASGKELLYTSSGDLFLIHIDTGKWEQLTKTPVAEQDAKLSPDGKLVAFRRGWDLYTLEIAGGKEARLTRDGSDTLRNGAPDWVYPEELTLSTAYWWSPDSKSIVYMQFDSSREPLYPHADFKAVRAVAEPERYPQAGENNADIHLGVVPAAGGVTRWLEIGDTRNSYLIARAGWMPDSKSVYAIRMNRVQNRLELLSIGVESGAANTILREADPYWINEPSDPRFLKDGKQFLWLSERDGFKHLYLYSIDGRDAKQITKGNWEVRGIAAVDEADGRVFFNSSEPSPIERHLFSIRLNGKDKKQLTQGAGTHTISMGPGGSYYLDTYSSFAAPSRVTLHSGDGAELGVYREADKRAMEEFDLLPTELVTFKAADGATLYGRLIKPKGFEPGKKYPVIVDVYGGPGVQSIHNSWAGPNLDQVFAHKGYLVWQVDNRGGSGYGHAFESPIYRNMGPTELTDQVAGVKHLVSLGIADPARVGVHGWSYGGFMTLNLMLNAPDVFHCGVSGAPVTSWMNYDTIYTERYMGLPKENAEAYKSTALPPKAANLRGKLMIMHNIEDDNVLFQNTLQMVDALEQAGKQFEFVLYTQKSHGVSGPPARHRDQALVDFFDRNLK